MFAPDPGVELEYLVIYFHPPLDHRATLRTIERSAKSCLKTPTCFEALHQSWPYLYPRLHMTISLNVKCCKPN
jgi:hypothetical protein